MHLPDVTLCCIDAVNHALAIRAMVRSQAAIRFARSILLTDDVPAQLHVPSSIEVVPVAPLRSRTAYSQFVLKWLGDYVTTSHVLLVQWDGFVINAEAWTPEFLECDYLGAKWFWYDDGMRVGNGGFSLRSKRLLEALKDSRITLQGAEDETIGRTFRLLLEREHAIRFGSEALADRFAFEAAYPIGKPFGFHGLFNFCRALPSDEIASIVPLFSDAIATSPQLAQLLRNCAALGQWDAVDAIARRVLDARPEDQEAQSLLQRVQAQGGPMRVVGRNEPCPCGSGRKYKQCHGALSSARAAPASDTAAVIDGVIAQGLAAHQNGDIAAAEKAYQQVLYWNADHPIALHYLGVILYQRRLPLEALPLLERAAQALPNEPEFHNNLGLALAALDRIDEAISAYRRTLALKPQHPAAWNNLGLAFTAANRLREATDAYREAIARAPQFGQAHWNLALALLATNRYEEGWREYEWRLKLPELGGNIATPSGPRWDGRVRAGATILLAAEQGLGDAIQFARFAEPLAGSGMHVMLQVPESAKRLLGTVPGVETVIAPSDATPPFDACLPLLSIAGSLGVDKDSIPCETPYLFAEQKRRRVLRDGIAKTSGRLKVGIAWAGSPQHANDARRSIAFPRLAPLLAQPDVAWFSLQRDERHGAPLLEWPARETLDDTAALIAELDLVITVDTSIAHLAGALDRPTWLLLPYAPDWRWGIEGDRSPWYASMRLFRQQRIGDWEGVVEAVRHALAQRIATTL